MQIFVACSGYSHRNGFVSPTIPRVPISHTVSRILALYTVLRIPELVNTRRTDLDSYARITERAGEYSGNPNSKAYLRFIAFLPFFMHKHKHIILQIVNEQFNLHISIYKTAFIVFLMHRISRSFLECFPKHYENYANYDNSAH